jgi:hypothetical protein
VLGSAGDGVVVCASVVPHSAAVMIAVSIKDCFIDYLL